MKTLQDYVTDATVDLPLTGDAFAKSYHQIEKAMLEYGEACSKQGVLDGIKKAAEVAMSVRTNAAYIVYNLGAEEASIAIKFLATKIESGEVEV